MGTKLTGDPEIPSSSVPFMDNSGQLEWPIVRKRMMRWMVWPIIYATGCWTIFLFPSAVSSILPWETFHPSPSPPPYSTPPPFRSVAPPPPGSPPHKRNLTPEERKLVPETRHSAWLLGRISGFIEANYSKNGNFTQDEYLDDVAAILHISMHKLTREKILEIGELIEAEEHTWSKDTIAWLLGLMTIVNILWCFGVCGIACSIGPVLYYCFQPVIDLASRYFFIPLFSLILYIRCLYEPLSYSLALYITATSTCFSPGPRDWLVVTGIVLSLVCFCHWKNLWLWESGDGWKMVRGHSEIWDHVEFVSLTLGCAYVAGSATPLALKYDSSFLGVIATGCLYGSLGAYFIPYFFGRFDSNSEEPLPDDFLSVWGPQGVTCLLLCLPYALVKTDAVPWIHTSLTPLLMGLAIFGPVLTLVWGLIISSYRHSESYESESPKPHYHYTACNVGYAILLLLVVFLGYQYHVEAILNLGLTFATFWILVKILDSCQVYVQEEAFRFVIILYVSLLLWFLAFFLHGHPDWLWSILS